VYMKNPLLPSMWQSGWGGDRPGGLNPYLVVIPRLVWFLQGGGHSISSSWYLVQNRKGLALAMRLMAPG
jgi:hypothetical protein